VSFKLPRSVENCMTKYHLGESIGQGTQSVVYRATDPGAGRMVAVKQIFCPSESGGSLFPLTSLGANFREVSALNQLMMFGHENIIRFVDMVVRADKLLLVFEHCDENLCQYIRRVGRKNSRGLPAGLVRDLSFQLLTGMSAVHDARIIHRDVKSENILLKRLGSSGLLLKVADFGLAKQYSYPPPIETLDVGSLWYRSPEVLIRSGYDVGMDLWGIGCVVGEMMTGKALFVEDCEIGMLMKIFQTLGTPRVEDWPAIGYAVNVSIHWPCWDRVVCMKKFKERISCQSGMSGFELLVCLLRYNSNERLRCREALRHDFFENSENRRP